jgi:hypothetical protein
MKTKSPPVKCRFFASLPSLFPRLSLWHANRMLSGVARYLSIRYEISNQAVDLKHGLWGYPQVLVHLGNRNHCARLLYGFHWI